MAKQTLKVVVNGVVSTRTTARAYTHCIISEGGGVVSWHSGATNAEKALRADFAIATKRLAEMDKLPADNQWAVKNRPYFQAMLKRTTIIIADHQ